MLLDVIVPGSEIGVADRPVDGDPFLCVSREVEITPAITLTTPHQRASADVVAAVPVEALHFGVRRILVGGPVVEIRFIQRIVALQDGVELFHRPRPASAMRILPRSLGRVYVARDVLDVLAALEHKHAQTFLGELLGGPSPGNSGPHDYRIVLRLLHQVLAVDWCDVERGFVSAGGTVDRRPRIWSWGHELLKHQFEGNSRLAHRSRPAEFVFAGVASAPYLVADGAI